MNRWDVIAIIAALLRGDQPIESQTAALVLIWKAEMLYRIAEQRGKQAALLGEKWLESHESYPLEPAE